MSRPRLTAEQIIESHDLGEEDSPSEGEIDLIEQRIETTDEEATDTELVGDDDDDDQTVISQHEHLVSKRLIPRSKTVEMVDES